MSVLKQAAGTAIGVLIGLLVGATLFSRAYADKPPVQPKVIQAQQFELIDSNNKVRAAFGTFPNGIIGLGIRGKDGTTRAVVGLNPNDSPYIGLFGKDATSVSMSIVDSVTPDVTLTDPKGNPAAKIMVVNGKTPVVDLKYAPAQSGFLMGILDKGNTGKPFIRLQENGKERDIFP